MGEKRVRERRTYEKEREHREWRENIDRKTTKKIAGKKERVKND